MTASHRTTRTEEEFRRERFKHEVARAAKRNHIDAVVVKLAQRMPKGAFIGGFAGGSLDLFDAEKPEAQE